MKSIKNRTLLLKIDKNQMSAIRVVRLSRIEFTNICKYP